MMESAVCLRINLDKLISRDNNWSELESWKRKSLILRIFNWSYCNRIHSLKKKQNSNNNNVVIFYIFKHGIYQ